MIEITGLAKSYGRLRVLRGVSLSVEPGDVTLLIGANGCGKSTTLRLLAGLSRPDTGRIVVNGHDLGANPGLALASLSYLPQAPRFHPRLTVAQILQFYADLRGLPRARISSVVERWGLNEYADVVTGRLSGGTRQRLGLAVLDLPDAPVLVLDEPGLSLDPYWRRELHAYLRQQAMRGRAVLAATHLLGEWDGQAHRCLVLDEGAVAREIASERLRERFPFALPHAALGSAG